MSTDLAPSPAVALVKSVTIKAFCVVATYTVEGLPPNMWLSVELMRASTNPTLADVVSIALVANTKRNPRLFRGWQEGLPFPTEVVPGTLRYRRDNRGAWFDRDADLVSACAPRWIEQFRGLIEDWEDCTPEPTPWVDSLLATPVLDSTGGRYQNMDSTYEIFHHAGEDEMRGYRALAAMSVPRTIQSGQTRSAPNFIYLLIRRGDDWFVAADKSPSGENCACKPPFARLEEILLPPEVFDVFNGIRMNAQAAPVIADEENLGPS